MTMSRVSAVSLILVSVAFACDDDSTSTSSGIAFEDLPARYAEAACAAYEKCFGPIFSLFLNGSDCAEITAKRFENGTFGRTPSNN